MRYFTDQNEQHENEFWVFLNSKMNVTNGVEKLGEKSSFF